jgi:hypothetical protein
MIETPHGGLFKLRRHMKPERLVKLKAREEVLEVVLESILPQVPKFVFLIVLFVLPFFFMFPLFREGMIGVSIFFAVFVVVAFFLWRAFFNWSRTFLLVTDRRVVDHDQEGLFSKVITEARFHQIDDVTYRIKGFWATIFRFGVLRIKLHGNAADIEFHFVKHPARIADLLHDLRDQEDEEEED